MKIIIGKVISAKMAKTATVEVQRVIAHPLYKKRMKKTRLFHIHDEESKAKPGDIVKFAAGKPHSKLKRWDLLSIEESTGIVKVKAEKEKSLPSKKKEKSKPKKRK